MSLKRREFLARLGQASAAIALSKYAIAHGDLGQALAQEIPGKEDMIVHATSPFLLETKLQYLRTFITPNKHFFVRNHYPAPRLDIETWQLTIEGEVETP
jgi:DMSO/TMAO reductase YedYZ molybdopterin-dependent catalytic subunit